MPNSAIHAVAELAASQHSVFTRRQAAALSFDRRRAATALAQGWLDEPYPGVLALRGAPATWEHRLAAAVLAGGDTAVASHRAAARLHRLDGFARTTTLELSVQRTHRWQFHNGVVAHHVTPFDATDVVCIDGIRVTSMARTLADLGSVVGDRRLVGRALTDARRRGRNVHQIRATAERLHRPGQRGTGVLLRHLDRIPSEGTVPDSWFEELLARCLDDRRIPEIVPQYRIRDGDGHVVARTDLGIPSVRLGLEAHSRRFHFGPQAEPLDEQRDLRVAACGWELLYLGWYATRAPELVVRSVADVVAARRREL